MTWVIPVVLLLVTLIANCRSMQRTHTGFLYRTVRIGVTTYPYVVYVPWTFDPNRRWPVVLFLHGAGERGSDGWRQTEVGLGRAIRWDSERFAQIVVVFPQAPAGTRWLGDPPQAAILALDQSIAEFSGDPDRVYLTGMSMGGYGTWHLAIEHPQRFAAIAPVCGGVVPPSSASTTVRQLPITIGAADPYRAAAEALPRVPVWIFHGAEDPVIPPSESRRMAEELRRLGFEVRYTEYPAVGHNSWERAYADPALWTWMLVQRRSRP